jgi:hypothetical protein
MQNSVPDISRKILVRLSGKVLSCLELNVDIVAPKTANKNQGNNGYVPVSNKFESIIVKELSLTRSPHSPVPWISGINI